MKYKIKKSFTIHKKINMYNFKLINKHFVCIGLLPNNDKSLTYKLYIKTKNKKHKSVNRNVLKRFFKEYIRVFNYNFIQIYIFLYITKYIVKIINYFFLNQLLRKLNNV